MKLFRSPAPKGLALAAGVLLVVLALPGTSGALSGPVPTLEGEITCDPYTGHQLVLWTLTNDSGTTVTIDSAVVEGTPALATDVTMSPNPVVDGDTSTGTAEYTGDSTGDTHLVIDYTFEFLDPEVDGEVVLPGGCSITASSTTTTIASTTTTEPETTTTEATAVAPAAVQAQPTFTG